MSTILLLPPKFPSKADELRYFNVARKTATSTAVEARILHDIDNIDDFIIVSDDNVRSTDDEGFYFPQR